MIEIRPASPPDLKAMCAGAVEPWLQKHAEELDEFSAYGPEWIMRDDGVPVMAGGFMEFEFQAALAWVIVAGGVSRGRALLLTKTCRDYLKAAPYRWIEAQVAEGFDASLRWVRLIGFVPVDGEYFTPDGMRLHRFVFKG